MLTSVWSCLNICYGPLLFTCNCNYFLLHNYTGNPFMLKYLFRYLLSYKSDRCDRCVTFKLCRSVLFLRLAGLTPAVIWESLTAYSMWAIMMSTLITFSIQKQSLFWRDGRLTGMMQIYATFQEHILWSGNLVDRNKLIYCIKESKTSVATGNEKSMEGSDIILKLAKTRNRRTGGCEVDVDNMIISAWNSWRNVWKKDTVRLNNKLYKTAIRPIVIYMTASDRHCKEQNDKRWISPIYEDVRPEMNSAKNQEWPNQKQKCSGELQCYGQANHNVMLSHALPGMPMWWLQIKIM